METLHRLVYLGAETTCIAITEDRIVELAVLNAK